MSEPTQYRLLTRSDFDGLVCAILLKELGILGSIQFVHPKDVQDGKIEVTGQRHPHQPALCPGAICVFDHHPSEEIRAHGLARPTITSLSAEADSAARVLYDYYGGGAFPARHRATDGGGR